MCMMPRNRGDELAARCGLDWSLRDRALPDYTVASRRLSADVCACGHTIAANALHDVKPRTDVCEIIHKCAIAAYRKHCYDEKG